MPGVVLYPLHHPAASEERKGSKLRGLRSWAHTAVLFPSSYKPLKVLLSSEEQDSVGKPEQRTCQG